MRDKTRPEGVQRDGFCVLRSAFCCSMRAPSPPRGARFLSDSNHRCRAARWERIALSVLEIPEPEDRTV
jgi:hypothetical protein